jgi:parallel beta-helix repeat protein
MPVPVSRFALALIGLTAATLSSAAEPDTPPAVNFTRMIRDAVQSGQATLKLPAGTHRIDETILIKDAHNLVIDGSETTLVMTNNRRGILYVSGGDRLAIRGLTLDYDPLPYTQGTITKADANAFEFEIHDGYPDIVSGPTHLFTAEGNRQPDARDFNQPRFELITPRKAIAHAAGKWPSSLAPGDQVVIDRRGGNNAVEIRNNTGPVLVENVSILSSPSLGVAGRYCEDTVIFRNFTLRPGPVPAGATKPRLFSTNADAINFVQCRRGPILEKCDISRQGDDALNVHGVFLPVLRVLSPTRFLTAFPYGPAGFVKPLRNGDPLRIYTAPSFGITGTATFASITTLAGTADITSPEIKACFPTYGSSKFTVYQVDLASPAKLTPGEWFDCPAVNGDGFIVRDSYFHDNRGRGLRVMASDGLIENNRFERITKCAISVGPELGYWREAGWVNNLRISGNTIRDIGVDASLAAVGSYVPAAIGIFVRTDNDKPPYLPGNRNIVIENNTITGCSVAGIHAYAAGDLIIRGNTLKNTNLVRAAGWVDPVTHLVTTGPISTDGLAGVTLTDNHLAP